MTITVKLSSRVYVNNTGAKLEGVVHAEIMEALTAGRPLDEELSDLISLDVIEVEDGMRGIVNFVDVS